MEEQQSVVHNDAAPRLFLQPIAAPSILGLFGFAVATMMVSTHMAGFYGGPNTPYFLFPFAAFFGGLAQFMAAMWSFRARDGMAVAMHGLWGSFWMAYGLMWAMAAGGWIAIPASGRFVELGMWFTGLAWVTWMGAWAAMAVNFGIFSVLILLAAGSSCAAIGNFVDSGAWVSAGGWLLMFSAICAWYSASGLMLESTFKRVVLPVGRAEEVEKAPKVAYGIGEPGVIHGQS